MQKDTALARETWARYEAARDRGHTDFVHMADKCMRFVAGDQWEEADKQKLARSRRPALTVNKIMSVISTLLGDQILARSEITLLPRSGANDQTAEVMSKVLKQISDNNQLDWVRSDVFASGLITSRGFFDVRIDYKDAMLGEVHIETLNPKNVVIDPDATDYDPDKWSEVFVTKWFTPDDIEVLYGAAAARSFRERGGTDRYSPDSIDTVRDRFGGSRASTAPDTLEARKHTTGRTIRVIERQYRKMDVQDHFVSPGTGDMRPVPKDFTRDRIAWYTDKFGLAVVPKRVQRVRWTVVADNVVLHDDWSPYKRFTIVPYFPFFMPGKPVGVVENLLGSQELLNKALSQELHIANTTANSGWIYRAGVLQNMTSAQLEARGAETGLVIEVNTDGDIDKAIRKITPNQVPTALDRISFKAEEHIKTISGVNDSMMGQDREDVAARAIQAKRQAAGSQHAKPLDNLGRTDHLLARIIIEQVQGFYLDERVLTIAPNTPGEPPEQLTINEVQPDGSILADMTLGEYGIVVGSAPQRETLEDSQFEQALALRQAGIAIDDATIIMASRLRKKGDLIRKLSAQADSPEARERAALELRALTAEVTKTEAEAAAKQADMELRTAKARKETIAGEKNALTPVEGDPVAAAIAEHRMKMDEQELALKREKQAEELALAREKHQNELARSRQLDAEQQAEQRRAAAESRFPTPTRA